MATTPTSGTVRARQSARTVHAHRAHRLTPIARTRRTTTGVARRSAKCRSEVSPTRSLVQGFAAHDAAVATWRAGRFAHSHPPQPDPHENTDEPHQRGDALLDESGGLGVEAGSARRRRRRGRPIS